MTPGTLTASLCGNKLRAKAASPHAPLAGLRSRASRAPDFGSETRLTGVAGQSKPDKQPLSDRSGISPLSPLPAMMAR